jgi:hypothetical protein
VAHKGRFVTSSRQHTISVAINIVDNDEAMVQASKGTTITNGRGYIGLFGVSVATENWNNGFRSIATDTAGTKEGASIRVHTC